MAFSGFRDELGPTQYPRDKTPVTVDYYLTAVISVYLIILVSLLAISAGYKGKSIQLFSRFLPSISPIQRFFFLTRTLISLFIGLAINVSIFGQSWEVAWVSDAPMPYRVGVGGEIHANIGVHIGLTSVNITLKGVPEKPTEGPGKGHRINYNERFNFDGPQGRIGFGRYSGRINREFRAAQWRGMPLPILWVAEYFTLEGEDILWGRSYRLSGYYAKIMLWLSWSLWLLAVILSFMSIQVCGETLCLVGASMLSSNILWASIRYGSTYLVIPIASQKFLTFSFGWSFYLCLFSGVFTFILGVFVIVSNIFLPYETNIFFFMEPPEDDSISKSTLNMRRNTVVPEEHVVGSKNGKRPIKVAGQLEVEEMDAAIHGDERATDHVQGNGIKLNGNADKPEIINGQSMAHVVNSVMLYHNIKSKHDIPRGDGNTGLLYTNGDTVLQWTNRKPLLRQSHKRKTLRDAFIALKNSSVK